MKIVSQKNYENNKDKKVKINVQKERKQEKRKNRTEENLPHTEFD